MKIEFQQTGTVNTIPGPQSMCSFIDLSANAICREAKVGGMGAVIGDTIKLGKGEEKIFITHYCPIDNAYQFHNYTGVAFNMVYRLRVVTGNFDAYWTGIYACVVGNNHEYKYDHPWYQIASDEFNTQLLPNNSTKTVTLGMGGINQLHFWDDYLYICIRLKNNSFTRAASVNILQNQKIDVDMMDTKPPTVLSFNQKEQKQEHKKLNIIGYNG